MNASKLLETLEYLMKLEDEYKIQGNINEMYDALARMVNDPQDHDLQSDFVISRDGYKKAISKLQSSLQPAQRKKVIEIEGRDYYLNDLVDDISRLLAENPSTLTVVLEHLEEYRQDRSAYISRITFLSQNLKEVGIEVNDLEEETAEIGFVLPRELFDNQFDKLIKELRCINRIIRAFSELETGTSETIEVRQISTSDPTFYFGLVVETIKTIGSVGVWALGVWKVVEEIRKLRSDTERIKQLKGEGIVEVLNGAIIKQIDGAVEEKVKELLNNSKGDAGRKNEQEVDLKWALESVLARVERGMTMELKFLPRQSELDEDGADGLQEDEQQAVYGELEEITNDLIFPDVEGSPILSITSIEDNDVSEKSTAVKKGTKKAK